MTADDTALVQRTTGAEREDPREAYRRALLELACANPRIVCLDSDMGGLDKIFADPAASVTSLGDYVATS